VYDVARESELEHARTRLSSTLSGSTVLLKREDNQPVFSFKLRGAYNKMVRLESRNATWRAACWQPRRVTMRKGVALAAQRFGLSCRDRDAGDDAANEDRCGAQPRRRGGPRSCCTAIPTAMRTRTRSNCWPARATPSSIRSMIRR
jgi:hypothetical protein